MLELKDIDVNYGKVNALRGISIKALDKMLIAILGSNGAGKSTLLNSISGVVKPSAGKIFFQGKRIDNLPVNHIVKTRIALVPERRRLFKTMTVKENIMLGAFLRKNKKEIFRDLNHVYRLFPRLEERGKQISGSLSGGEQQMVAIARALMASPRLLLLDEPSVGLSPQLTLEMFRKIREINNEGVTVLLVEQNANLTLQIASYAYIIETGEIFIGRETGRNYDQREPN